MTGGPVGWGQSSMVGSFDVPFGHLAFDEPGVGSEPPFGVQASQSWTMACRQQRSVASGGKIARLCERASSDAECGDEGDPVGVMVGFVGGFEHEGADGVVAAQVTPDLLSDQFW